MGSLSARVQMGLCIDCTSWKISSQYNFGGFTGNQDLKLCIPYFKSASFCVQIALDYITLWVLQANALDARCHDCQKCFFVYRNTVHSLYIVTWPWEEGPRHKPRRSPQMEGPLKRCSIVSIDISVVLVCTHTKYMDLIEDMVQKLILMDVDKSSTLDFNFTVHIDVHVQYAMSSALLRCLNVQLNLPHVHALFIWELLCYVIFLPTCSGYEIWVCCCSPHWHCLNCGSKHCWYVLMVSIILLFYHSLQLNR